MMAGPPFSPGFVQRAVSLVNKPGIGASDGLAGLADFSVWSSNRAILTSMVSLPPLPSSAFAVIS